MGQNISAQPMPNWITACPDWKERLLAGAPLVPDLPLFREEAEKALRIFKRLRIPDMVGKPRMGDVAGPWLFPIVEALFGSYDVELNRRMIQEYFLLVPKKNTKTSSAAAIMVDALIVNRRPEGEFQLLAPTKEIADLSYSQAAGTIRADSELDKLFQIQAHVRQITHRRSGARLKVKAADTDAITGGKPVGTLVDELHVFGSKADAAQILIEVRGALAARPDGFLIFISTQSKAPPSGVFKTELEKARDVRDGKLQLPLLPILYELPPELAENDGWKERRYWGAVNPNMGRSVDEAFLVREFELAEGMGRQQLALFASQHFNVQVGVALRGDRWAGADFWESAAEPTLSLEDLLVRCEVAVVGIDGGGLDDLLGVAVLGREKRTGRWLSYAHAWAHRIVLERRKQEAPKLLDFEREGSLTIVDLPGDDVEDVADIVRQVEAAGILAEQKAIGVDPVGIGDIVDELTSERCGIALERIVGISQGWKLSGAIKTTGRKLAGGELVHGGTALMTWAVGNAKVELRGNAESIGKATAGNAKIDPLIALFNAVALMAMNPAASGRSIYEERGLITLE